jgi:hypothetical protein
VGKIKKLGQEKLKEGDVKIEEKKEENMSLKDVFKKMGIYECQLLEWNAQCVALQEKINKVKYDNQIKMAEDRQRIEAQHENSIEEFKQRANQEASRNIVEIEKNIHLENEKLSQLTVTQRGDIEFYKKDIKQLKEINRNLKRDININQGTE